MCYLKYALLAIFLGLSLTAPAKEFTCTKYKTLPIILNACEGEGPCGNLESDRALLPVDIHKEPFRKSKIVDRLEKGDLIKDAEPYLVIKRFGKVRVLNPRKILSDLGVRNGDLIPFVHYFDETLQLCIGDHLIEADTFNIGCKNCLAPSVKILKKNMKEAWVKLKTPRNTVGYAPDISGENSVQWYIDKRS